MLFLRLRSFLGLRGLLIILTGGVIGTFMLAVGGPERFVGLSGLFGMAISAIAIMVVGATKYRRSSATPSYEEILIPLVRSQREYCLVLRPFGRDGKIILPKAPPEERRIGGAGFTRNMTMEQVVAIAVRNALDLDTYGIVDQNVSVAPPGLTFMRASNDEWKLVAHRLIRRAHSIVLILPGGDTGEGFDWEIEQIVRYDLQSRVIIVLPPCEQDAHSHEEALNHAYILLAMLDGSGKRADLSRSPLEYELGLSADTLVVRCLDGSRPSVWSLVHRDPQQTAISRKTQKAVTSDFTYLGGLVAALKEIEHDLSNTPFDARYSWD